MKYFVTGGTGFIGSHLVRALQAKGHSITLLARQYPPRSLFEGMKIIQGDITDSELIAASSKDADFIIHLAAIRDRWGIPFRDYYQVNVEGTRNVLNAAAKANARFIYCSTVGVVGHPNRRDIDETFTDRVTDGKYNYSYTKMLGENLTTNYHDEGRVKTTIVRPVITYGPGDQWGMITRLIKLLRCGRFTFIGDGRNHLHLCYISDLVEGFLQACERQNAIGETYILAGPSTISLLDLVKKICDLLQVNPPKMHVPTRIAHLAGYGFELGYRMMNNIGYRKHNNSPFITRDRVDTLTIDRGFCINKAQNEIGYHPRVDYDLGLSTTLEWWQDQFL